MQHSYDVIVIGGGPAGATASGLLAKRGRRVLVLEREKFPRYHIGESLVPGMMPVLRELDAIEVVEALDPMKKFGGSLLWGDDPEPWSIDFDEACIHPYAYEIKRAEFDNLLLTHSRRLGSTVIEEASVRELVFEQGRCVGVRYSVGRSETVVEQRARIVIDCSGQAKLLARRLDTVEWHEDLKNLAVWTYFQGGIRYEGRKAGNIVIENNPPGWLWMIPFSDGSCSVGFVAPSADFASSGLTPPETLRQRIADSKEVGRMLAGAIEVAAPRTAKDWSYTSSALSAPGVFAAGDAAAFIDPLFSTGVMLAMKGSSTCAKTVNAILDAPEREEELRAAYEHTYRTFLESVLSFVRFFYDPGRKVVEYFERAKALVDPTEALAARQDFILLISGLHGMIPVMEIDVEGTAEEPVSA